MFDCSAVAPELIEADLFGAVKGAFTGAVQAREGLVEQAHGGTLFLDEVGELPLALQPKLLRMLEAREVRALGSNRAKKVDVRGGAATHRNLREQVASSTFRQDLYYRLAVLEAHVPPLRERPEDIPLLVERLLSAQTPPRTLDLRSLLLRHAGLRRMLTLGRRLCLVHRCVTASRRWTRSSCPSHPCRCKQCSRSPVP